MVSNVFIGQSETPLIIRSLLSYMTISEVTIFLFLFLFIHFFKIKVTILTFLLQFHVLITGGFATVSGSALAAYIEMGNSPPFLLSASVMAAPGALALSKVKEKEKTFFFRSGKKREREMLW